MVNPDGVISGNSRLNLSGADLNRKWSKEDTDQQTIPETSHITDYIKQFQPGKIMLFLDIHGSTKIQKITLRTFEENFTDIPTVSQLQKKIDKWLTARLLPTLLQK